MHLNVIEFIIAFHKAKIEIYFIKDAIAIINGIFFCLEGAYSRAFFGFRICAMCILYYHCFAVTTKINHFHRYNRMVRHSRANRQILEKGDEIFIEGELRNNRYKKDGKHIPSYILVTKIKFNYGNKTLEDYVYDCFII